MLDGGSIQNQENQHIDIPFTLIRQLMVSGYPELIHSAVANEPAVHLAEVGFIRSETTYFWMFEASIFGR